MVKKQVMGACNLTQGHSHKDWILEHTLRYENLLEFVLRVLRRFKVREDVALGFSWRTNAFFPQVRHVLPLL